MRPALPDSSASAATVAGPWSTPTTRRRDPHGSSQQRPGPHPAHEIHCGPASSGPGVELDRRDPFQVAPTARRGPDQDAGASMPGDNSVSIGVPGTPIVSAPSCSSRTESLPTTSGGQPARLSAAQAVAPLLGVAVEPNGIRRFSPSCSGQVDPDHDVNDCGRCYFLPDQRTRRLLAESQRPLRRWPGRCRRGVRPADAEPTRAGRPWKNRHRRLRVCP